MESALGEGSTFHIELPRLRSQELDGATTGLVIEPSPESNGTKILVVDDEMTLRTVLARRLTPHGYHVDVAADGDQAWRMLNQNRYGCILLDLRMPGLACQDLYRRIVDLDLELAGRILFMTGDTVNPETKKFMDTVPNLLLANPLSFLTLSDSSGRWLNEVLSRQRSTEAIRTGNQGATALNTGIR